MITPGIPVKVGDQIPLMVQQGERLCTIVRIYFVRARIRYHLPSKGDVFGFWRGTWRDGIFFLSECRD